MRKFILPLFAVVALAIPAAAFADRPHFISASATQTSDTTVLVNFKEAGLGDFATVDITATATASCINPGSKHPKAANKVDVGAGGSFTVKSGQVTGSLTLTAAFQPSCSPPMTVVWGPVTITDTTSGASTTVNVS
jgi:hypothetical protein